MADISQFPITKLVFPFAIPSLEGPTYFSRFQGRISFKKEQQNPSVNSETFTSSWEGMCKTFAAAKPLEYYSLE